MPPRQLIHGLHGVIRALRAQDGSISQIWLDTSRHDERADEVLELATRQGLTVQRCARATLGRLTGTTHHQGVAAQWRPPPMGSEKELHELVAASDGPPILLVLDGVQDPHNLGACLRGADGAGVAAVVVPRNRAVGLTPAVCKVASGAAQSIPLIQVTNLARTLRKLKEQGLWIIGCTADADADLYDEDLRVPVGLVLGAEGTGLRRLTRSECDRLVHIPMSGTVGSLNVAVAAAVSLFEARRQRRKVAG